MPEKTHKLAERLAALAAERGWSHSALSARAGLGKGAVGDLIANPERRPRDTTVAALARALEVDVAYLTGRTAARAARSGLVEGLNGLPEGGALRRALEAVTSGSGAGLRAYRAKAGVPGLGVGPDAIILVDPSAQRRSGDLVMISLPGQGAAIRYIAEPYLIGFGDDGRPFHDLMAPEVALIGRVVATINHW